MSPYVSFPDPSEVSTQQHQYDATKPHTREPPSSEHQQRPMDSKRECEIRLLKRRLRELQSSVNRHISKEKELNQRLSMQQYDLYCFKQSFTELQKENLSLSARCDRYRSERDNARYPNLFTDCGHA